MKSERFTAGQLWIERNRRREGPPVVYTVLCGKSARPFTDPKAILKWVKWPKGTPTGDALREWLASFEQKPQAPAPELDMAKIKAEGFGPEAHDDDPTANTKMVTMIAGPVSVGSFGISGSSGTVTPYQPCPVKNRDSARVVSFNPSSFMQGACWRSF